LPAQRAENPFPFVMPDQTQIATFTKKTLQNTIYRAQNMQSPFSNEIAPNHTFI
jgi:hypothetical protein